MLVFLSSLNVKSICQCKFEISHQPLGMDVLCSKQEELFLVYDVCHVVVGTVAAVAYEHALPSGGELIAVAHLAKRTEFVLVTDGLQQRVVVGAARQVVKGIYMDAVKSPGRMSLGDVVFLG